MASSTIFTREKGIFHEEGNDFTELYGSFTTEKYQRDFTFITKTIIRTIIALIILFCLLNFNILANIKKHIVQKIKIKSENIWTKSGQKQRNGTHQMKELNGIANTLKGTILEMKHSVKEIVRFAIQSLPQKQMHKNSVLTLVNHNTVGTKDLIMNIGTASFVGISLRLINIQSQKPVLRNVQTNTVLKSSVQDVYDLTIEDKHEFLANEILVHNCFDAVRYCHIEFNRPQMEMKTEKSVRSMGVNY
jgi:intein/homing endonuclease